MWLEKINGGERNLRNYPIEEGFGIMANIGVVILVDGERSTGVLHCRFVSHHKFQVQWTEKEIMQ